MKTPFLNCSTIETANQSIVNILNISEKQLQEELCRIKSVIELEKIYIKDIENLNDFIKIIKIITHNDSPLNSILSKTEYLAYGLWFHSTRTHDSEKIREKGLFPTSRIKSDLKKFLENLSHGLTSFGIYKNQAGASMKIAMGKEDDGPHAFLLKRLDCENNFLEIPEIIEDIAGEILGEQSDLLVERYKKISKPCFVIFFAPISQDDFLAAFLWIFLIFHNQPEEHLISEIKARNFNGKGSPVPPNDIYDIEFINTEIHPFLK